MSEMSELKNEITRKDKGEGEGMNAWRREMSENVM